VCVCVSGSLGGAAEDPFTQEEGLRVRRGGCWDAACSVSLPLAPCSTGWQADGQHHAL